MLQILATILGALTIFVLFGAFSGALRTNRRHILNRARRMESQRLGGVTGVAPTEPAAADLLRKDNLASNAQIASLLGRFSWAERRASTLEQGDLPIKVSEYALMLVTGGLVSGAAAWYFSGFAPAALVMVAFVFFFGEVWVTRRAQKRLQDFSQQLPGALQLMAVSLQSGFGIMDAIRTVARDMDAPLSIEFNRILDETRAGGSFEQALDRLAERMGGSDLRIVVQALSIHRQVGGDLGAILGQVAETMREREKLRRDISSMTAQERMSATIVAMLPVFALGFFVVAEPSLVEPLWTTQTGQMMAAAGLLLEVVGFFLMRRVTKVEA